MMGLFLRLFVFISLLLSLETIATAQNIIDYQLGLRTNQIAPSDSSVFILQNITKVEQLGYLQRHLIAGTQFIYRQDGFQFALTTTNNNKYEFLNQSQININKDLLIGRSKLSFGLGISHKQTPATFFDLYNANLSASIQKGIHGIGFSFNNIIQTDAHKKVSSQWNSFTERAFVLNYSVFKQIKNWSFDANLALFLNQNIYEVFLNLKTSYKDFYLEFYDANQWSNTGFIFGYQKSKYQIGLGFEPEFIQLAIYIPEYYIIQFSYSFLQ
ncbi:MAG: hypothetical protein ACPGLV_16840 [Bacteroidia bacterium]